MILVTSGAVGVGRQRLRYRRLLNSRFQIVKRIIFKLDFIFQNLIEFA